jgi:hypothetical protein
MHKCRVTMWCIDNWLCAPRVTAHAHTPKNFEFSSFPLYDASKDMLCYRNELNSKSCLKPETECARGAQTTWTRHNESNPLASGRSTMSPRRIAHILLCSWPETLESDAMPFVKRVVLWLGGIALHHELIAANPKILISHLIRCFIMP